MADFPSRTAPAAVRILVVDLEPTPYKTDLWNAFSDSSEVDICVIYTEQKNWAPDGGHNYVKWPEFRHAHVVFGGKGLLGRLRAALSVSSRIIRSRTDLITIAGYDRLPTALAILCATTAGKRFAVHADEFNTGLPGGRLAWLKLPVRELLRKIVFSRGGAVLVCGKRGVESALRAGCPGNMVLDFPYVVDAARMRVDAPSDLPADCRADVKTERLVVFFSGRMIPRKGLPTLLSALSKLETHTKDWILWIEGDGPELESYRQMARDLGVADRCRFLGFCQYDLHSWLIRSSAIVVVPSLQDPWGIVVDEGIQLGKVVISSDATGSGYDRIENGRNGFLFPAGDTATLAQLLQRLIHDDAERARVGSAAAASPGNVRPQDNLKTLLKVVGVAPQGGTSA